MTERTVQAAKYPVLLRVLHWLMAAIIVGMLAAGLFMVRMPDRVPAKFDLFYPYHKSFGLLVLLLVFVRLAVRKSAPIPALPAGLANWEVTTSKFAHVAFYVLLFVVPLMGYALSSSYTQSDGIVFFGALLPELLPKNDANFEIFRLCHRILAYCLLGLIVVHVAAALKHRLFDRDKDADVLSRMF